MGIGINAVGNYSPHSIANPVKNAKVKQSSAGNTAAVTPNTDKKAATMQDSLMPEEKDFFAKLYPDNKADVADYHFYERSGKLSGVKLGSLIDRRG